MYNNKLIFLVLTNLTPLDMCLI